MTAATIVLASLSVLGGGLVAFLAWRDVHPSPPAAASGESLAALLAARYRPAPPEPVRAQDFAWTDRAEVAPAPVAGPDVVTAFVELLGATSLDDYARDPEARERVRSELVSLLAARA